MTFKKNLFFLLAIFSIIVGIALIYISIKPIPYFYYIYVRIISSVTFIGMAMYIYQKYGFSGDKLFSNMVIVVSILLSAVFIFYRGSRFEWIQIDRFGGLVLLIPVYFILHSLYFFIKNNVDKIFEAFFRLITIGFVIFLLTTIYRCARDNNQSKPPQISIEDRIMDLDWENYSSTKGIIFANDKTYEIFDLTDLDNKKNTIEIGVWELDSKTNSLNLISDGKQKHLQYSEQLDFAFLGENPIENSTLNSVWISTLKTNDENEHQEQEEQPS
jgi:hypothetical protein